MINEDVVAPLQAYHQELTILINQSEGSDSEYATIDKYRLYCVLRPVFRLLKSNDRRNFPNLRDFLNSHILEEEVGKTTIKSILKEGVWERRALWNVRNIAREIHSLVVEVGRPEIIIQPRAVAVIKDYEELQARYNGLEDDWCELKDRHAGATKEILELKGIIESITLDNRQQYEDDYNKYMALSKKNKEYELLIDSLRAQLQKSLMDFREIKEDIIAYKNRQQKFGELMKALPGAVLAIFEPFLKKDKPR